MKLTYINHSRRLLSWQTLGIVLLIIGSILIRISQFIPNVAPISAIALLGGATLATPAAFVVPLLAMLISDSIIGFDAWQITLSVYGSFIITVLLGMTLRRSWNPWRLLSVSILSSVLFYLVTNAAVWKFSGMYPPTIDGLWLSYWLALPFFRNTILGDMAYTFSLFLAVQYVPQLFGALKRAYFPRVVDLKKI